jgi:hypothetical protein
VNPGHVPRRVATYLKKLVILGPGAVVLLWGISFGHEVHAEPAGLGAVVATTVGDRQDWDNCIVTSATRAIFKDSSGSATGNDMLVNLNCYSRHSTASSPGFSAASPEGRASQPAEQQLAAKQAAQAQAEQDELAAADAQQGGG